MDSDSIFNVRGQFKKVFSRQSSILGRQSDRPVAAVALSFSMGIAGSLFCRQFSFVGFTLAGIFLIYASFLALRRDRISLSLILGLAAISIGGLLMALAHRDGFSDSDLRFMLAQGSFPLNEPASFEGCVVRESESRDGESIAIIELHAFLQKNHWVVCKGNGILRITEPDQANSTEPTAELARGDRVRGWATWRVPRNYENPGSADRAGQLARRGIFVVGRVKSPRLLETIPGDCSKPWTKTVNSIRARVRTSLDPIRKKDKGQSAAILASLVVGDYSWLDNSTREVFQNAGAFHVLVVSGLHVAWIAGLLLCFFKLVCLPERMRYLLVILVMLLYTGVVGFQASITRCLWMFLLYLIGRMIFRRADIVNILLASALILLAAQPLWLFEAGFQFSFLSVMAIAMTAVPAVNGFLRPVLMPLRYAGNSKRIFVQPGLWYRLGRSLRTRCEIFIEEMTDPLPPAAYRMIMMICRSVACAGLAIGSMILTTLSVQMWLEPLLAYNFNRLSWIAPLANLIIVPLASTVLAAGIVGSLAAGFSFCGPALIRFAGSLSSLLLSAAASLTEIPGAWQRCPTPRPAWVLGGILLLSIWSFFEWRRFWIPCFYVVALLACISCNSIPALNALFREFRLETGNSNEEIWQRESSILSFTFLDVGEGDSIVIRFPDSRLWVLDAGGLRLSQSHEDSTSAFDIGEAVVSRYLWHSWIHSLDRLILSHTDLDHAGGMPAVMNNFQVARLDYAQAGTGAILDRILSLARERRMDIKLLHAGAEENAGLVTVRALNPPARSRLSTTNENSLVLQFCFKRFSALLTGDLEKFGETEVLSQSRNLRSQLLKVAHHGSRHGTSDAFLDRTRPRWAVISVGRNNPYGHPSPEVFTRLLRHGTRPILTLDQGAITFETDGIRYAIRSHVSGILEQGELW